MVAGGTLASAGCNFSFPKRAPKGEKPTAATANPANKASSRIVGTARVGPGSASSGASDTPGAGTDGIARRSKKEVRVGEVRVIGAGRRFVLIEVAPRPDMPLLASGLLLRTRLPGGGSGALGGGDTATLRVSPERREPFIVADVVGGEPHVDDVVVYSPDILNGGQPAYILPPELAPAPAPTVTLPTPYEAPGPTPKFRATATVHPVGE